MDSFINAIASGLISGSLFASMALGLTILYGISHVWNFGHGIIAVTGGYITWTLMERAGLGLLPSLVLSLPLMAVFGGLGSTTGTIYAAVILGLVEAMVALYLGMIWVWPVWFFIFMITLLFRPQGILGGRA